MNAGAQSVRARGSRSHILGGVLVVLNSIAVVFSIAMLLWAIQQLNSEGEPWGLLGVLVFGGMGLGVQALLLLLTILLLVLARKLTLRFRVSSLVVIALAMLIDGAAVGCVFYERYRTDQAFIRKNPMYQSGLRQAVLDRDVGRARAILQSNPGLGWETDFYGQNALMLAARAGDRPMVEMLLEHGFDAKIEDYNRITALQLAVRNKDVEMARLLLDRGARVNNEDKHGKTALVYARAAGSKAMIDLLVSRGGKDADYEHRLVDAVQNGDIQLAAKLLDQGLPVDTSVPNGHCLLDFAAEKGNLEMARFLISRGASVKRTDGWGRTPLHWASGEGNAEMIGFLIDQGADPNAKESEGMTPLHEAIYWAQWHEVRSLAAIKVLAGKGADINAKANKGLTPLKYAGTYGTDSIRAYLRSRGARE